MVMFKLCSSTCSRSRLVRANEDFLYMRASIFEKSPVPSSRAACVIFMINSAGLVFCDAGEVSE